MTSLSAVVYHHRDLPLAIMISLGICASLYVAVCLVITGLVKYSDIDVSAPLTSAFQGLDLGWVESIIGFGAVAGLSTTLLIGLYAQSRVYLSVARDGLIPPILAEVHPTFKTPIMAQALCGGLAMILAAFFNVKLLSEILDIGVIIGYGKCTHHHHHHHHHDIYHHLLSYRDCLCLCLSPT